MELCKKGYGLRGFWESRHLNLNVRVKPRVKADHAKYFYKSSIDDKYPRTKFENSHIKSEIIYQLKVSVTQKVRHASNITFYF